MARILVLESDAPVREWLRRELQDEGHEVLMAVDAAFGMRVLENTRPDLLISELYPEGADLSAILNTVQSRAPVLVVAGRADFGNRGLLASAMAAGAACVLEKPLNRGSLVDTVTHLLARFPRSSGAIRRATIGAKRVSSGPPARRTERLPVATSDRIRPESANLG